MANKKINLENALILGAGLGIILLAYFLKSDNLEAIFHPSALLIVIGGTFCAGCLNFSFSKVIGAFSSAKRLFFNKKDTTLEDLQLLSELVKYARRKGILALKNVVPQVENEFLKKCLRTTLEENSAESLERTLRTYVSYENKKDVTNIDIFEELGGYAPTFGIVGAVIGLIQITSTTQTVQELMPGIATAFCATLWGLALANIVFLPISGNFKNALKDKIMFQNIVIKSVVGIFQSQSTIVVNDDLQEFVDKNLEIKPQQNKGILSFFGKK